MLFLYSVTSEGGVKNLIGGKGRAIWNFEPIWTMMQCYQMEWVPKFVKMGTLKKKNGSQSPQIGTNLGVVTMFQVFRVAATQDTRPGCSVFIFNQYENKFFYVGSFLSKVVCFLLSCVNISCRLLHCYCSYGNTGLPST